MIALIWLLAVLRVVNCIDQLPTRYEIESSINRTIDEVERMVRDDPSLPRLSRREIVDILFNITSTDMRIYEDTVKKTRNDYQRALMVVLPYSSNSTNDEALRDLYTKAPLTKFVKENSARPETSLNTSDNLINVKNNEQSIDESRHYENHRDTYSEVNKPLTTQQTLKLLMDNKNNGDSSPQKFSFDLENFGITRNKGPMTGESLFKNFIIDRVLPTNKSNLEIVYSTSVTQRPTTNLMKTTGIDDKSFRPTLLPAVSTDNILTFNQWHYNAPPSSSTTKKPLGPSIDAKKGSGTTKIPFLPTMITEIKEKDPQTSSISKPKVSTPGETSQHQVNYGSLWDIKKDAKISAVLKPEVSTVMETSEPQINRGSSWDMKKDDKTSVILQSKVSTSSEMPQRQMDRGSPWDMENLRIVNENEKQPPIYVTPMSSTSTTELGTSLPTPSNPVTTKTSTPMREEVKDLLASIGLTPDKNSKDVTWNNVKDHHENIFGTDFQIPQSNNVIKTSGLTAIGIESPSISSQNTFAETPKDVKMGFENLSPDVQLLFQRFGLQSSAKERENIATRIVTTEKPRIATTNFWNNFKPLPSSRVKDDTMRDFLAKYGLGNDDIRKEKSMKTRLYEEDEKPSLIEAVPDNMKMILENIGLITRSQKTTESPRIETTVSSNLHVFKPHETLIKDKKQRAQINKLLDTVKMVQDGKANITAVQAAAKELLETSRTLKNGPDPLSLEEILRIYNDGLKNEIKRQQDPMELTEMAISESNDLTSTLSPEVSSMDPVSNLNGTSGGSSDTSVGSSNTSLDTSGASSDTLVTSTESTNDFKNSGSLLDNLTTENSNLDALADSFGGSTASPDPVLPTPRKTGLYFLVDWNTFLEVGEEEKDKVNLRFQPKVGDRTRFIPVTVP